MKACLYILGLSLLLGFSPARAENEINEPRVNKLLHMYQFYYLPFSVEFRQGKTINDIIPFMSDNFGNLGKLLKLEDLQALDKEWNALKEPWKKKSLLINTPVSVNDSVRISNHLISHHVALSRSAFDRIPLTDRIVLSNMIRTKPPEIQAQLKQLRFLKSFLGPTDDDKFNFFVLSPSWCESSREYRILLEAYLKQFPDAYLNLHSVVIEDPKEEIFDSNILKEFLPHPKKYTHDSVPRFLAMETLNGKTTVWEEGEALRELYERFFKSHRGFLDSKTSLFRETTRTITVDPSLSSVTK